MEIELPRLTEEWNAYKNLINSSNDGKGIVFKGNFYRLEYEQYTKDTVSMQCAGVKLTIRKNLDNTVGDFKDEIVLFDEDPRSIIDKLNGKPLIPFKIRFKEKCTKMIESIKDFDNHNKKVEETAKNIIKCRMNIDSLVSEITNGESVTYSKLISDEMNNTRLLEGPVGVKPSINRDAMFMITPDEQAEKERPKVESNGESAVSDSESGSKHAEPILIWDGVSKDHLNPSMVAKAIDDLKNKSDSDNKKKMYGVCRDTVIDAKYTVRT